MAKGKKARICAFGGFWRAFMEDDWEVITVVKIYIINS
jgi:hypothetical protein